MRMKKISYNLFAKKKPQKTKVTTNIKKYVKKAIDKKQEVKQFLQAGNDTSASTLTVNVWSQDSCFSLPNGAGDDERIGDKVRISSIYVGTSFFFQYPDTLPIPDVNIVGLLNVRIIVVQLKRGYTITELITQLPTDSVTAPLSGDDITRRCYILADRKYSELGNKSAFLNGTDATVPAERRNVTFNLKPKITNAEWDSTTSGNASPDIQGGIYILYLLTSQVGGLADVYVNDDPDVRINYRDA